MLNEQAVNSSGSNRKVITGLSKEQVLKKKSAGQVNVQPHGITLSVAQIIKKNTLTLFNLINLLIAVAILLVGHIENILFLGVAIGNTAMGIFQELRAKKTLDELSILAKSKVSVLRDGQIVMLYQDEIVLDDIVLIQTGNQICADSVILSSSGLEVDESLLTGESDNIKKNPGDKVMSGSFATAGYAYVKVEAVGRNNYATAITIEAKKEKAPASALMSGINNIIRALTVVIIPLGALLFYNQFSTSGDIGEAVLGASAAMIGMIPEGLILLTGVTMTVGALKLARKKALVQSLPSIETLARVDVLCLDKTGTITDGTLSFESLIPINGVDEDQAGRVVTELMGTLQDNNSTALALIDKFGSKSSWTVSQKIPFSSDRKWSGANFRQQGSFVIGAPGSLFEDQSQPFFSLIQQFAAKGNRVLCLGYSKNPFQQECLPQDLNCAALIILSDTIRPEAPETFKFFAQEGVTLKVISGDDPLTVSTIASKAGIENAEKYIDLSRYNDFSDYVNLVENYTVFGRVSPQQKRELIKALKQNGHTACMTGDGVNDVLAMKEANCSVAMIGGSDAARGACDFVLMTSNFAAMIDVLKEGRQVINNIETVSSLYLVKTIYSILLSIIYIIIPYPYPFAPLQMTPINSTMVGLPSFFLALRKNHKKPQGRFLSHVLENSLPAAVTVIFNILLIQIAGIFFELSQEEMSTMNVLLTGVVGFAVLYRVAQPIDNKVKVMFAVIAVGFAVNFLFFGDLFMLSSLFSRNIFFYLPLMYISPNMFKGINSLIGRTLNAISEKGKRNSMTEKTRQKKI